LFEDPVHGLITVSAADIIRIMDARYLTMTAQEAESTREHLRDPYGNDDNIRGFIARHRELHAILLYNNNTVNPRNQYTHLRNAISASPMLSAEIAPFVRAFSDPGDQTFERFAQVLINATDNHIIRPGTMIFAAKMDDLNQEVSLMQTPSTHKKPVRNSAQFNDSDCLQQTRMQKQYLCLDCGWKSVPHPNCVKNRKK
jgi:hypothetical protein